MFEVSSHGSSSLINAHAQYQLGKNVLVMFPDPTEGTGTPTNWQYKITEVSSASIKDQDTLSSSVDGNCIKIALTTAKYTAGEIYEVQILNGAASLIDTWYFTVFDVSFGGSGSVNVARVNDAIRRIAGLLGLYSVVEITEIELGVPRRILISIYDKDPNDVSAVKIAEYEQRFVVDETRRPIGQISARRQ